MVHNSFSFNSTPHFSLSTQTAQNYTECYKHEKSLFRCIINIVWTKRGRYYNEYLHAFQHAHCTVHTDFRIYCILSAHVGTSHGNYLQIWINGWGFKKMWMEFIEHRELKIRHGFIYCVRQLSSRSIWSNQFLIRF